MANFTFNSCPQCKSILSDDRVYSNPIVCSECGYTDKKNQRIFDINLQSRTIKVLLLVSLIISVGHLHSAKWGAYSLEIIPLALKGAMGVTSSVDLKRKAHICKERQMYSCMVQSFGEIVRMESTNLPAIAEYAKSLEATGRDKEALGAYNLYFSKGGKDADLAYNYALLLSDFGQVEDAKKYFEYTLDAKPGIFQITVSRKYAEFLIKNNQISEAKEFIKKVRKMGENAPYFMESELKEI